MGYELSIVRLKKGAQVAFPAPLEALESNPIAGTFDARTRMKLQEAVSSFPYAHKVEGVKHCYEIEAPGGGRLEVLFTTDGGLFLESQAGLELALSLFLALRTLYPDMALEDPQRGLLHDATSFDTWMCGQEEQHSFFRAA